MKYFQDRFGRKINLTDERLAHILEHPEIVDAENKIEETLLFPQRVVRDEEDSNVWLYYRPYVPPQESFLLVIVKVSNGEGFVITAFVVKNIRKGGTIWKAD